jgi:chaperonin GroEL
MDDLAIATGGEVISSEVGLKLAETGLAQLGRVRRAVVTKDATTLVDGGGSRTPSRAGIEQLKREVEARTPTGTARSCRSGWRSCPAALR